MDQQQELDAIYNIHRTHPALDKLRMPGVNFVPGTGPMNPAVMIVGDAPSSKENKQGIPFQGQSGEMLRNMLLDVGIRPVDVFLTNAIKYWPYNEDGHRARELTEEEIDISGQLLEDEIRAVRPGIVGLLGRGPIKAIYPDAENVYEDHGTLLDNLFVPLYPPSVLKFQPDRKDMVTQGFIKLAEYAGVVRRFV
jgi:uracil-DNA glycosylase